MFVLINKSVPYMGKTSKPRRKREPSAKQKLKRDLVADRKTLRKRIKELLHKNKKVDRDIASLR